MKVSFTIIILLMSISNSKGQIKNCDTTYLFYHDLINQAERWYFVLNNVDSSLAYYDRAFEKYNYVFLKDLMNAAQISVFEHRNNSREYLLKGFKYGLQMMHFDHFPLLKPHTNKFEDDTLFMKQAKLNREYYIRNINYEYLLKIYDIGIKDQLQKSHPDVKYAIDKKNNLQKIKGWITKYGFPSSKILGIDDKNAFRNIEKPEFDIDNRKLKFTSKLDYYTTDDNSMSSTISIILLIHNQCAFLELQEILYAAMLRGEIHPREVGMLYDNMYRDINSRYYKCNYPDVQNGLFYLNLFCNYERFSIDKEKLNDIRAKWKIVEVEVDHKKKKFEEKYGFKLFYGFWKCL